MDIRSKLVQDIIIGTRKSGLSKYANEGHREIVGHFRYPDGKIKKKPRFPFEVFSAGSNAQKKSVAVMPEDARTKRPRKGSVGEDRQHLHKTSSIPDLSSGLTSDLRVKDGISSEEVQKIKLEYAKLARGEYSLDTNKRNYCSSFLPSIKGSERGDSTEHRRKIYATFSNINKRKSVSDSVEVPKTRPEQQHSVPSQKSLPLQPVEEKSTFQIQQEQGSVIVRGEKKESWSENQRANLELLVRQQKRVDSRYPKDTQQFFAKDLENLQLPLSGIDKVWKTLHTKLRPIDKGPKVESAPLQLASTNNQDLFRQTAYFQQKVEGDEKSANFRPAYPFVTIHRKQKTCLDARKLVKEETINQVNVTFGDTDGKKAS